MSSLRPFALPAFIYATASLVCTQIPLLNYLGYEFSLLMALLASITSGMMTVRIFRDATLGDRQGRQAWETYLLALRVNLSLLIIPLVMMATNAFFVRNCSLPAGLAFFLLLPVVSAVFATSCGFFCAAFVRHARTLFLFLMLCTLVYAAFLGYTTPAISSYNFFYGYFPGLTYDEALGVGASLVAFRAVTLAVAGMLVWLAVLLVRSGRRDETVWSKAGGLVNVLGEHPRWMGAAGWVLVLAAVYVFRSELGFESPTGAIQRALGARYATEHFTIYYAPESYTDEEIRWVGAEHEYRLRQILDVLNLPFHGMFESYLYPSAAVKRRWIGAAATNIAKPWSGQMHLTAQTLDAALKHELVHLVMAPFGVPVLRASLSTGLVEGVAMALEWDWGHRTLHTYAAGLRRAGLTPPIQNILRPTGFVTQSSSISYVLAGSFCRFLIDRFGIRKMTQLYRGGEYADLYGRTLDELVDEWHRFLDRVALSDEDMESVDVMFRQPSIFRKVCARVVAERISEARSRFAERRYGAAFLLYRTSFDEADGVEALGGYLSSALRMEKYDVLTSALDTIILRDTAPARYLPLFLTIGDAFWAEGDTARARALYGRVRQANFSERHTERAIVRSVAVNNPVLSAGLRRYFLSDDPDSTRPLILDSLESLSPGNRLTRYLKGRLLLHRGEFDAALAVLQTINVGAISPELESLRLRSIGVALMRTERFQEAKAAFWESLNFVSTEVAVNAVFDHTERCDWLTENWR